MNVEQALEAIVRSCIKQIRANVSGVTRFHDIECLHQLRVGLRRLDAVLALFGDVACIPKNMERDVEWLMGQLGPARDWDVLAESTLPRVRHALPAQDALAEVRMAVQEKQRSLHGHVTEVASSARFETLLGELAHWVERRSWRQGMSGKWRARLKLRVTGFADDIMEHTRQRLIKRGSKLKGADAATRHRMRIAAKRARYATEFFAALYPRKRVRPYVLALSVLQDELGLLNDAAVANKLLGELGKGGDRLREGAALVRGYLASCQEEGEPKVRRLLKKFTSRSAPH
ncbi:MAG: CHAD domain-containing protein [Bdellovibrionales bacterium]|nr:CHAD domain-containing protein [Massilia sp.]